MNWIVRPAKINRPNQSYLNLWLPKTQVGISGQFKEIPSRLSRDIAFPGMVQTDDMAKSPGSSGPGGNLRIQQERPTSKCLELVFSLLLWGATCKNILQILPTYICNLFFKIGCKNKSDCIEICKKKRPLYLLIYLYIAWTFRTFYCSLKAWYGGTPSDKAKCYSLFKGKTIVQEENLNK